jgi:hypothetical protein
MTAERASKLLVVGWTCVAMVAMAWRVGGWPPLFVLSMAALFGGVVLASIDRRVVAPVLVFAYIYPAIIQIVHGQYHVYFGVVWMAALLGVLLPDAIRTPWRIPVRWRAALACWALVLVAGATIVAAREIDFNLALLGGRPTPGSVLRGVPAFSVMWTLHVSLVALLGILWFDWLFSLSSGEFTALVIAPLGAGFVMLAAVATYQMFGHMSFLNATVFGRYGRASGTVFDANVCGTIAAMWIGAVVIVGRNRPWVVVGGGMLGWLAVWASGSKTAFAAALLTSLCGAVALMTGQGRGGWRAIRLRYVAGVCLVLLFVALAGPNAIGPVRRMRRFIPEPSLSSVGAFAVEMWNRNNYGATASVMIRTFPWFGVGPGGFNTLASQFAPQRLLKGGDNAQNWYRQEFAELGLVGSLGWMLWVAGFGWILLDRAASPLAWSTRGALLALGFISLVGVPGQDMAVTLTFWTFAFWHVSLSGVDLTRRQMPRGAWVAVAVVVIVYGAGTAADAVSRLRPPMRAARAGLPYTYGFYAPESDGAGGEQRWAQQHAVTVLELPRRWIALRVGVNHHDIAERPVAVKAWCEGTAIVDTTLTSIEPATVYVYVPPGRSAVTLETWVSRVVHPSTLGVADARELGLLVSWNFVDLPPPGATVVRLR